MAGRHMREKCRVDYQLLNTQLRENKLLPFSQIYHEEDRGGILKIKEIIDRTSNTIFLSYREELLSEPITYIIPAVWGKIKQGKLTDSQKEIFRTIDPIISDIFELLELDVLNDTQELAIEYLIRGLIISKITYLIEASKQR